MLYEITHVLRIVLKRRGYILFLLLLLKKAAFRWGKQGRVSYPDAAGICPTMVINQYAHVVWPLYFIEEKHHFVGVAIHVKYIKLL